VSKNWLAALRSLGILTNNDPLAGDNIGASQQPSSINLSNTTHSYSAPAYLVPNATHQNLAVLTSTLVEKINWSPITDGGDVIASGVTFTSGGNKYRMAANKKVLICSGAVNSPQLLKLSGIGAINVLNDAGILLVVHLPTV